MPELMKKSMLKRFIYSTTLSTFCLPSLFCQEARADTSALGYKVGYHLGSWLPFLIIIILVVLIIRKSGRQSQE